MKRVGIIGASGFAGAELMRLCATHPDLEVAFAAADSQAGTAVGGLYPSLAAAYPGMVLQPWEAIPDDLDVVFLALPHGTSQSIVPKLSAGYIIDLGADFRLDDTALYPAWYGQEHTAPELLDDFVYGLPELFRTSITGATRVAVPGCYVTTAALTLAPLVTQGLIEPTGIVVDAASGVSGAGRAPKASTAFSTVDENFTAYGLLNHRHTPEMQMALSRHAGTDVELLFTPHLAPMNRGILATCYARPTGSPTGDDLLAAMQDAYEGEPFVVVSETIPSTKATLGSNSVHLTVQMDERTGWVVAIGALDNLVKGAAGQAIQCTNLALGLPETAGLAAAGMYP
ncbi:MAG: N-acetyl-gamma-glutamyl-phosphate reductase [Acidimicrobiia bacterium]|nr:N-acetyl-gamma-glutamyl-phosphate reductase [Acidimicrobiia bacterium]NNF10720.1 N-acetyl-gamma-glutamyl-phosphate reductase [Acidimicrobiia bacterium]NNL71564.1 N-acetyl-gamma-glutamyl-phosphate reductase [Acidimicrobiia bacterium]